MFDLGIRKDPENLSPPVTAKLAWSSAFTVSQDITEQLHAAGTPLESVNAVIWSHSHADHIG
jgi:phosphoribosyl 1,2-cyclic phosphodiesterase